MREERRLRMFENMVLRRIFGAKRVDVTGVWRKLHHCVVLCIFVLFYACFVLFYVFLCCFMYFCVVLCMFCVVLCIFVLFYVFFVLCRSLYCLCV